MAKTIFFSKYANGIFSVKCSAGWEVIKFNDNYFETSDENIINGMKKSPKYSNEFWIVKARVPMPSIKSAITSGDARSIDADILDREREKVLEIMNMAKAEPERAAYYDKLASAEDADLKNEAYIRLMKEKEVSLKRNRAKVSKIDNINETV